MNTSGYYSFFHHIFDAADVASSFWQPILKAVGRTQLELASLQAQQAQAALHWTQQVLQPRTPVDIVNANAQLWAAMFEQCIGALPRVVAAVATASGTVAPVDRPLPEKRPHDTLILLDRDEGAGAPERRVA
jgi:hypothetical protein